jgi:CDP-glucose 4,6-dehydratase
MEFPLGQRLSELPGPLLLTGHTGFKGTWMTFLLERLNVPVIGYSLPAEKDSLYDRAERKGAIPEEFSDIRDYDVLERFIDRHKPSTIIHMAAQPLVLESYETPRETFDINVMGTANLLDIAFKKDFVKVAIVVTTDKVYKNDNLGRAFIESDPLEGKDPYSASKVGTEAVVAAWQQIAKVSGGPKVVSVRAGNVIGGGDFAANRIIPDLIRGVMTGNSVEIRNPSSTRPWQHVLDPLSGYICAAESVLNGKFIGSVNFGPRGSKISVAELTEIGTRTFPTLLKQLNFTNVSDSTLEARYLEIDSEFSNNLLNWTTKWDSEHAIELAFEWWGKYLKKDIDASSLCRFEVTQFLSGSND